MMHLAVFPSKSLTFTYLIINMIFVKGKKKQSVFVSLPPFICLGSAFSLICSSLSTAVLTIHLQRLGSRETLNRKFMFA